MYLMCVCLSVGYNREPTKTNEPIEMPFEMQAGRGIEMQLEEAL